VKAPEGRTSMSKPQLPAKAISRAVVRRPPSLTSCPAATYPLARRPCTKTKSARSSFASSTSGVLAPSWLNTWAALLPPMRHLVAELGRPK